MTTNLPPTKLYSQYLNIASLRFNISIDECRNRFGLYTCEQWDNLFNQEQL